MAFVDVRRNPTPKELRVFGFGLAIVGLITAVFLFAIDWRWGGFESLHSVFVVVVGLISLLKPERLRGVYLLFVCVTFPVGWVVSYGLLAVAFFLVMTPMGLLMRLFGRDAMNRRFDSDAETYWVTKETQTTSESAFRQF